MTHRRGFIVGAAAALSAPTISFAQKRSVLRFIPHADVAVLDPIAGASASTRNHALLVFDTLYGVDESNRARPQMVAGHTVEMDGLQWTMTLREGLRFHDGSSVLAKDVVSSIRRWWQRDNVGRILASVTDELSWVSDRMFRFRLKIPFPTLPDVLGKLASHAPVVMPDWLARTSAFSPVPEIVGSGPYRFVATEHVPGSKLVYEKFDGYQPRFGEETNVLAGAKIANFDRVEWSVMPEAETAAAALLRGEVDWWESPHPDYWPKLAANRDITLDAIDTFGTAGLLRFNFIHAPTNSVLVRRAALAAISQREVMMAVIGEEPSRWKSDVGFFLPGSTMASDVGLDAVREPPDRRAARKLLNESGYSGDPLVFLVPGDLDGLRAQGEVLADALRQVGFNIDMQITDWGTLLARASSRRPPDQGGWHLVGLATAGSALLNPLSNGYLRGDGPNATFGWPDIPQLEELRMAWLRTPDEADRVSLSREIQRVAFETVPYVPTGIFYLRVAYRKSITGVQRGMPLFYGVRRA